jgi:hypothetical protein
LGLCFFLASTSCLLIFFGPKAYLLFTGADLNAKLQIVRKGGVDRAKRTRELEARMKAASEEDTGGAGEGKLDTAYAAEFLKKEPATSIECEKLLSHIKAKLMVINLKAVQDSYGFSSSSNPNGSSNGPGGGGGNRGGAVSNNGGVSLMSIDNRRSTQASQNDMVYQSYAVKEVSVKMGPRGMSRDRIQSSSAFHFDGTADGESSIMEKGGGAYTTTATATATGGSVSSSGAKTMIKGSLASVMNTRKHSSSDIAVNTSSARGSVRSVSVHVDGLAGP